MANSRRNALKQLRDVKARRERRARSTLFALTQQEAALQASQAQVKAERATLRGAWRDCGAVEQTVDHGGLQSLKVELAEYSARDHALTEQLAQLAAELARARADIETQRTLLRQAARDQEKLDQLIESSETWQ